MGKSDSRPRSGGSNESSMLVPILLIVGLVIGIPAIIGGIILFAIFGMAFFVTKAGVEMVDNAHDRNLQMAQDMQARQREEADKAKKKQAQVPVIPIVDPFPKPNFEEKKGKLNPTPPIGPPGKNMWDLIPLIDVKKDAVDNRRWEIVDKALHCKEGSFVPRLEIPYQPPVEYDFIVTFSQPGLRNGISMVMPNPRGGSFFFHIGSQDGAAYGFAGKPNNFDRHTEGLIKANTAYTVTVHVRRTGVRATLDGKDIYNLTTNFSNLTTDNWRQMRDPTLLAVACDDPTVFHFVHIVEITGAGKRLR